MSKITVEGYDGTMQDECIVAMATTGKQQHRIYIETEAFKHHLKQNGALRWYLLYEERAAAAVRTHKVLPAVFGEMSLTEYEHESRPEDIYQDLSNFLMDRTKESKKFQFLFGLSLGALSAFTLLLLLWIIKANM